MIFSESIIWFWSCILSIANMISSFENDSFSELMNLITSSNAKDWDRSDWNSFKSDALNCWNLTRRVKKYLQKIQTISCINYLQVVLIWIYNLWVDNSVWEVLPSFVPALLGTFLGGCDSVGMPIWFYNRNIFKMQMHPTTVLIQVA